MLSFDWNAPPRLPEARAQRTFVTVGLAPAGAGQTPVSLHHAGWGHGGQRDQTQADFDTHPDERRAGVQLRRTCGHHRGQMSGAQPAHGRRKFVEVIESFPEPCRHLTEVLVQVYAADAHGRDAALSPAQRLLHHHQTHSAAPLRTLNRWMVDQFEQRLVEPKSYAVNPFNYLQALQRDAKAVIAATALWLPRNLHPQRACAA